MGRSEATSIQFVRKENTHALREPDRKVSTAICSPRGKSGQGMALLQDFRPARHGRVQARRFSVPSPASPMLSLQYLELDGFRP